MTKLEKKPEFNTNINFTKRKWNATESWGSNWSSGSSKSRGSRKPGPRTNSKWSKRKGKNHPMMVRSTESSKPPFQIWKGEKPVRIWSLMWLEEVGQCIFIEYEDDMIIVDAGMEFSANETLGADYIIPDIRYIKQNINKLRWIVLSHWHLDHIWALRDLLPELGFPTIYTTPLTLGIIKKTFDNKSDIEKIKYKIVDPDVDLLKLGAFTIEFIHVNHNIPETMAMAIQTPKGLIFNSADFKIDHTPAIGEPADLAKVSRIGQEMKYKIRTRNREDVRMNHRQGDRETDRSDVCVQCVTCDTAHQ